MRLRREVAVKLLRRRGGGGEERELFEREARILASVAHPGVVAVFDYGEWNGQPFLVMEHVRGPTLSEVLRRQRDDWMPLDVVLGVARQLADALHAVHHQGILHGDVKPGNVMLRDGVEAVLVDFGLAQATNQRRASNVAGTPHYLAPEEIRGVRLQGAEAWRSDLYSLAVTVYEMLTGSAPFDGGSVTEILSAHLHRTPRPLCDARPDVPLAVESVLTRAMSKEPGARHASCAEFIEELRAARNTRH
jgi:serine/threonine-protein kinase